jgi:uncharacterized protein YutE (UPF0331/DUF86 family)
MEALEIALRRLHSKRNISAKEFFENWEIQDIVIREFQIAIEACIDISTHIISEKGWRSPEKYKEIADILSENNVINIDYKEIFKKIIAFRNVITHEYLQIDLQIVYSNLQKLDDLRQFASFINAFLEK